jgi:ribose transport system ATP-binding protein
MRGAPGDTAMTVQIRGLSKAFNGAAALAGVDFEVHAGEVHALLGPNGAGKSTLIRCLSGAVTPDAGEIAIGDDIYTELTPKQAMEAGVAVIYQNMSLIPSLTVTENIFLGVELTQWGLVRRTVERQRTDALLRDLFAPANINPDAKVRSLPFASRQLVEVAKALNRGHVKLLILDEPTAALTESEAQMIFHHLRKLRQHGLHIIYITHRLAEVFEIADRVTVLRDGKVTLAGQRVASINEADVVTAIAGEPVAHPERRSVVAAEPVLIVKNLTGMRFGPIDLEVAAGGVVGLFGALGSGRTELLETIYGSCRSTGGQILMNDREVDPRKPAAALAEGIALVPADRLRQALFGTLDAVDNILLPSFARLARFGFRRPRPERLMFASAAAETNFPTALADRRDAQLSGGTQQKLIVGRWLQHARPVSVLLMDEPTQGVDVGTSRPIHSDCRVEVLEFDTGIGG